jgi:hypothetical protein
VGSAVVAPSPCSGPSAAVSFARLFLSVCTSAAGLSGSLLVISEWYLPISVVVGLYGPAASPSFPSFDVTAPTFSVLCVFEVGALVPATFRQNVHRQPASVSLSFQNVYPDPQCRPQYDVYLEVYECH